MFFPLTIRGFWLLLFVADLDKQEALVAKSRGVPPSVSPFDQKLSPVQEWSTLKPNNKIMFSRTLRNDKRSLERGKGCLEMTFVGAPLICVQYLQQQKVFRSIKMVLVFPWHFFGLFLESVSPACSPQFNQELLSDMKTIADINFALLLDGWIYIVKGYG